MRSRTYPRAVRRRDPLRRRRIGLGQVGDGAPILGLLPEPHVRVTGGRILYDGQDLLALPPERMRAVRGGRIAMIFQEPMTALNPVLTIGRQIDESIEVHTKLRAGERRKRVLEMLAAVHLPDPERILSGYPHQLSGGQRQRAMIAMALVLEPALIIADEPTTALDVTTQAQILSCSSELQARHGTGHHLHHPRFRRRRRDRRSRRRHAARRAGRARARRDASLPPAARLHAGPARRGADPRAGHAVREVQAASRSRSRSAGWRRPIAARRHLSRRAARTSVPRRRQPRGATGRSAGLVGESGSGKSTVARCIVGLERADRATSARGDDIAGLSRAQLRPYRKAHPDGVPGPLRLTQSALARGQHHRAGPDHPRHTSQGGARRSARAARGWSASIRTAPTATRTSSPAASASASASPGRWP